MAEVGEGEVPPIVPVEKIVQPHELEPTTMDGWIVIEALSFDGLLHWNEQRVQEPNQSNNYQSIQFVNRTEPGKQIAFRVRKSGPNYLTELRGRLSFSEESNKDLERLRKALQERLDRETKSRESTQNELEKALQLNAIVSRERDEAKNTLQQLTAANAALEKELKDFERVKRVFGLRAIAEALMKSDAVDVLKDSSPTEGP